MFQRFHRNRASRRLFRDGDSVLKVENDDIGAGYENFFNFA